MVLGESGLWTVIQRSWKIWQLSLSVLRDKRVCQYVSSNGMGPGVWRDGGLEPGGWLSVTSLPWVEGSSHLL